MRSNIDANLEATGKFLTDPAQANPAKQHLQKVRQAVQAKSLPAFMASYAAMTSECNGCHRSSGYASIAIQIPLTLPVPNQLFVDQAAEGRSLAH